MHKPRDIANSLSSLARAILSQDLVRTGDPSVLNTGERQDVGEVIMNEIRGIIIWHI